MKSVSTLQRDAINNVNLIGEELLVTPKELKEKLPLSQGSEAEKTVMDGRQAISDILERKDHRLIVLVGPCSIHDVDAAREYADQLKKLRDEVQDTLYIVMRVYFEKPRTSTGWKGLINDPNLDGTFKIKEGLREARALLLHIAELGIPTCTEALDPIVPQYLADLLSWVIIGARTSESQTHREMASGLSMPVGFKNSTDGSLDVAVNAMCSAASPHSFLGLNQYGQVVVARTRGNAYSHVILRGGKEPNYDSANVARCEETLKKAKLPARLVVDCSHANSHKKHDRQPMVAEDIAHQIIQGNQSIMGIMLESNLNEGNQSVPEDLSQLKYGVSVTDACINWKTTESLLRKLRKQLKDKLPDRNTCINDRHVDHVEAA